MIYTERKVSIKNDKATIDSPIILFRGDREVEIMFTIVDSKFKFESNKVNVIDKTQASFGQLAVALPDGTDLFTEIVETQNGVVVFSITGEMIDEIHEVGFYSFHIRLYNDDKSSRITLPPVMEGIEIREPLIIEGDVENTDLVGDATVGYSMVQTVGADEEVFDEDGNYIPTVWGIGDKITAAKLNKMETGLSNLSFDELHEIRKDMDNYFILTNKESTLYSDLKLEVGRIECKTGAIQPLSSTRYITVDVSDVLSITLYMEYVGASDLGYAFYDENNNFISGDAPSNKEITMYIPEGAKYFRYGHTITFWETNKDRYMTLVVDKPSYNVLDSRMTEIEEQQVDIYELLQLDKLDNMLPMIWNNWGNMLGLDGSAFTQHSRSTILLASHGQTHFTGYLTLNVTNKCYFRIRLSNGSACNFSSEVAEGVVLYQNNTTNKLGEVIYGDGKELTILIERCGTTNGVEFSCFEDSAFKIPMDIPLILSKGAVFKEDVDLQTLNRNVRYYSRPEKINSNIKGKNILVFSDSQSGFIEYLARDWGVNIYHISNGGCRMGYVIGSGLGGETGDEDYLWLCNGTRVGYFNDVIVNNNIQLDYIVNFSGGNGTFAKEELGNAEEMLWVLNNKKWFGETKDDLFYTLSSDDKARFTSPICYIAAFITINNIYPNAIPVVVDMYNYAHYNTTSGDFENNRWKSYDKLVGNIYNANEKNNVVRTIANMVGAILVKGSESGLSFTNCPYYAPDSVHGNEIQQAKLAWCIGQKINNIIQ